MPITFRSIRKFLYLFFSLCFGFLASSLSFAQPATPIVDEKTYKTISGVWNYVTSGETVNKEYSWGESKVLTDGSVVIDLGGTSPMIYAPQTGILCILRISEKSESSYELIVRWEREHEMEIGTIIIKLVDSKHLFFIDNLVPSRFFDWSGPEHELTKVDGP